MYSNGCLSKEAVVAVVATQHEGFRSVALDAVLEYSFYKEVDISPKSKEI